MKKLPEEVVNFFSNQGFVIVSSIDSQGYPHSSCKGIIEIDKDGKISLLDLYKAKTYENLKRHPLMSITAVDEHRFKGYCLKGKAKIVNRDRLSSKDIKSWEEKITKRLSQRVLKNIHGEKGHPRHPELSLPLPEYMIVMGVDEIIDLAPQQIR
jgi:predicted pyridoxine 5'-phosphate oxidase superfamily flavin-nucleotide-binding protein